MSKIINKEFIVGNQAEYELRYNSPYQARWQFKPLTDFGSTGVLINGKIINVTKTVIEIKINIALGLGVYGWPNISHELYDPLQWHHPGWLRHYVNNKANILTYT